MTDGVVTLFGASLTLAGTVVILVVLDWQLALMTFLVFPLLGLGYLLFSLIALTGDRSVQRIRNVQCG